MLRLECAHAWSVRPQLSQEVLDPSKEQGYWVREPGLTPQRCGGVVEVPLLS